MDQFNPVLFKELVDGVIYFGDIVLGYETIEEAEITDHTGKDITACFDLPIFPQLSKIEWWRENMDIFAYHEIKEGDKVVGAKGIIKSYDDVFGADEPIVLYELSDSVGEEPSVQEVHADDLVRKVFSKCGEVPEDGKGSSVGEALIEELIQRYEGTEFYPQDEVRYKCLLKGENLDIWKVGFINNTEQPYQLFITGPEFIGVIDVDKTLTNYLKEEPLELEFDPDKMSIEERERVQLYTDSMEVEWHMKGNVDLD